MNEYPKIRNHYGFPIEIHPGGRRVWPPSFKRFVREQIETGVLTVEQVTKECHVSKSLVYKWRYDVAHGRIAQSPLTPAPEESPMFAEVVLGAEVMPSVPLPDAAEKILLRGQTIDLTLPANYPVADLIRLVRALER